MISTENVNIIKRESFNELTFTVSGQVFGVNGVSRHEVSCVCVCVVKVSCHCGFTDLEISAEQTDL